MSTVYLICGKLACGKSYYSENLRKEKNAVVLSCDEIMLALFGLDAGKKHDEIAKATQKYLFGKSLEITETGTDVILDFGLWTKESRAFAKEFYNSKGIEVKLHYIDVSDEQWQKNINKRNSDIKNGSEASYYVDKGLLEKMKSMFEIPDDKEVDVWYINTWE